MLVDLMGGELMFRKFSLSRSELDQEHITHILIMGVSIRMDWTKGSLAVLGVPIPVFVKVGSPFHNIQSPLGIITHRFTIKPILTGVIFANF